MENAEAMKVFMDIQSGLPRQGPGSDEATRRALIYCADLVSAPKVLDIGCGPGRQTLVLAEALRSSVTAVDIHQEYLDELEHAAIETQLKEFVAVERADMSDLPFAPQAFDLIWSEGAAYIMGVDQALREWRRLLTPDGYLVFSELIWLTDNPPKEAASFFDQEYPAMTDINGTLQIIERAGYHCMEHFTLDDGCWWDDYYSPLEAKLPALREKYKNNADALAIVEMTAQEISMRKAHGEAYGYEMFVLRAES
mgnify:CR=1 FL=1|tara:strand:+ start:517 stop:1275 length:759 start_codon:yes stop_codon:yes gene_type:complete